MPDLLSNAEHAQIDPRKLRDYVLDSKHESGRYKAEFFEQMGYTAADWERLEQDIRAQHLTQPAEKGNPSPFGRKFVITAALQGPHGSPRQMTTVWLFRPGKDFAELITIEPAARRRRT